MNLLYVGIGPESEKSKQFLNNRLECHLSPDSSKSTLRRSLACLLSETLTLQLEVTRTSRKKHSNTITYHHGLGADEKVLSKWIDDHAKITWTPHDHPWDIEAQLIQALKPPLNIKGNTSHPFKKSLYDLRQRHFMQALLRWKDRGESDRST
jgi:hypothetical protein